jgi:hypothetical protein
MFEKMNDLLKHFIILTMENKFRTLFPDYEVECDILNDLYCAVSSVNAWDFIAGRSSNRDVSYNHACLSKIHKAMNYPHHTGASYRWAMWHIHYIAKHGWAAYSKLDRHIFRITAFGRRIKLPLKTI